MSAARAVAVAGVGQTRSVVEDPRSIPEMVLEAVEAALADAALGYEAIDAVVTASVDLLDGLTASNVAVTEVVGAVMKGETRIAADGLVAALQGFCQVRSGAEDVVLVVAHAKPSMSAYRDLTAWAIDPIHLQPLGVDFLVWAGLEARALCTADPGGERRWAETAARRLADAGASGVGPVLTAEEVLASEVMASPLRAGMCAPLADSACAAVLAAADRRPARVTLTGVGHDLSAHAPGDRDLASGDGLQRACRRAYALAGISDPASEFDLLEPSCAYAHEEEIFLAATGAGGRAVLSPTGGLFAGMTPVAAGLSRLVAATRWLREAERSARALVHGAWGPAGQGQVVAVLEATP